MSTCVTQGVSEGLVERADRREWPERWPVLGPLVGVGVSLGGTGVGIVEGDWVAAAVFVVPGVVLGWVAWRNASLSEGKGVDDSTPPTRGARDSPVQ
jgi:hypothetical protein